MMRAIFLVVQSILAVRVFLRMAQTSKGSQIVRKTDEPVVTGEISVIVPVLDEVDRLGSCLSGLRTQGPEVREIVVVDGGSRDGTIELVRSYANLDPRIRLVDAAPVPAHVNGKAYGLATGAHALSSEARWIVTIDADVRPRAGALAAMIARAKTEGIRALSVATSQRVEEPLLGMLHPSMLTTLVYRFGIPGSATTSVDRVQANGQCFLVDRSLLEEIGGFENVLDTICEDVTLARSIAARGEPVGFYEGGDLVEVEMYRDGADAWRNWTRSLPMRDGFSGHSADIGLAEVALVQAAPPLLAVVGWRRRGSHSVFTQVQLGLTMARLGVLFGTARAYSRRPWTYWLSPLADLPVAFEIARSSRKTEHTWRGRTISTEVKP